MSALAEMKPLEKFLVRAEPAAVNAVYDIILANAADCTIPIETMSRDNFESIYARSMYWFWRDRKSVYAMVNLSNIDVQSRQAEFGVVSLVRRQGYGAEACFALFRFTFRSMGMNRLWCRVNADNVACLALIEKEGALTREGIIRQARFKNGRYYDQYQFSILLGEVDKWGR